MSNVELKTFVNRIKQNIEPGDKVIIVTTGYSHNVCISEGIYEGMKNEKVTCTKAVEKRKYFYKDTGKEIDRDFYNVLYGIKHNDPEYNVKTKELWDTVELKYTTTFVKTTLKLNRIFKLA